MNDLRRLLGADYLGDAWKQEKHLYIRTSSNHVEEVAEHITKRLDGRLIHLSAVDYGWDGIDVVYHYAFDHIERHFHVNVKVRVPADRPELPSVTAAAPQASWSEREMMDMTAVRFTSHPDPRHLWLPSEWPETVESGKFDEKEVLGRTDKTPEVLRRERGEWIPLAITPKAAEASLILLGPYHPLLIESAYFRLKVDGEDVVDADIKVGWNHRGIMKLFESRSYSRGAFLAEKICGICNVCHTTAYLNAVETLMQVEVPERARYIRTLMAELERIHSHLLWLGVAGDLIGFKTLFMLAWRTREHVLDALELISGSRRSHDMNLVGGVRTDIPEEIVPKIEERLKIVKSETRKLIDIVHDHPVARKRLDDIGVLDTDTAKSAGAVGPTARGSDWKIDVRWSDPYAAYGTEYLTWDVVVEGGKDAWARTLVRLRELLVSVDLCKQCLDALKRTGGLLQAEVREPNLEEAIGKAEAPRGELFYYIVSDGTNIPYSVRIRTPSYRNNAILPHMLKGYTIADAPIIIGSIDPCYSCTDRKVVVEEAATGKTQLLTVGNIHRKYRKR